MEGVGARLGRSSSRYGATATVFSGPVRKWKKGWVSLSSPNNTNNSNSNGAASQLLLLYKWAPVPPSTPDEPPAKKYRYISVSVIEEPKKEAAAKSDDENKPSQDPLAQPNKTDGSDVKVDVNDVIMEEAQASEKDQTPATESNETNLDLSLGLKSHDDSEIDPKLIQLDENTIPSEDTETRPAANSEAEKRTKRKATMDLEMRV